MLSLLPRWNETNVSASFRLLILLSPLGCRFSFQDFELSRPPVRSLSLRPGDSLITPRVTLSIGFRDLVSLPSAIQAIGLLALTLVGLPPTEHTSLSWTHNPAFGFPELGFLVNFS